MEEFITCNCRECGEDKPHAEFVPSRFNARRTKGTCRECWSTYMRKRSNVAKVVDHTTTQFEMPANGLQPLSLLAHTLWTMDLSRRLSFICQKMGLHDLQPKEPSHADDLRKAMPAALVDYAQQLENDWAAFLKASQGVGEKYADRTLGLPSIEAPSLADLKPVAAPKAVSRINAALALDDDEPKGAKPTSRASTPWPKKDGEVSAEEMALHLAYLKELMAYSEANPHESIPTGRGTVMKGGREYGMDGKEAYMTLDPVYKALSRERSTDSLENW